MTLLIARGTLDDVAEADVVIREAAEWLIKKGEPLCVNEPRRRA